MCEKRLLDSCLKNQGHDKTVWSKINFLFFWVVKNSCGSVMMTVDTGNVK